MVLPSFNQSGDAKLSRLEKPKRPEPPIDGWLLRISKGRNRSDVRVLDVGCGRGDTVAWLLGEGFDAYGLDVRAEYVANGRGLLGPNRLVVLDGAAYPFPDNYFDVVVSDQVLEHVEDLESLAREVARTTKPGGLGLHVFPSRWRFIEPHLRTPIVHWLPKGRVRRYAINLALRAGWTAPYFAEWTLADRTTIFSEYSDRETFYRPPFEIRRVLEEAGLSVDFREVARERVLYKLGKLRLPVAVEKLAVWVFHNTRMVYLASVKPDD